MGSKGKGSPHGTTQMMYLYQTGSYCHGIAKEIIMGNDTKYRNFMYILYMYFNSMSFKELLALCKKKRK